MSKILTIQFLLVLCLGVSGQITMDSVNMPYVGYTEEYIVDNTATTAHYGSAGVNQVWDFSSLHNSTTNTATYSAPNGTQHTNYPTANLMATTDGTTYLAMQLTTTVLNAIGLQTTVYGNVVYGQFTPAEILDQFPTQYGGNYSGSWTSSTTLSGSDVGEPLIESVTLTVTDTYYDTIDGWGIVKTPLGSFNALRDARRDMTHTKIIATPYIGSNTTVEDYTENTLEFQYLAKEARGAVVKFNYDSAGDILSTEYADVLPYPVAHFTFVYGDTGKVNFTDSSSGSPTTYAWTFGDGGTSAVKNPSHTYLANGTYYVCETVTNTSGSDTYCDSVHVTDVPAAPQAPVAVEDLASVTKPDSIVINVTANDHSPTGDNFCVTRVSNPAYFSVLNCNDVVFHSATATAPGKDSAWYVICNTGSSTLCDSALVIVTVNPAGTTHEPPIAQNVFATDTQPHTINIDVTLHDTSPSNDSFCVTSVYGSSFFTVLNCNDVKFTPDSNFAGYDTAYYIVCNTGEPNLCDTAQVIVDVVTGTCTQPVVSLTRVCPQTQVDSTICWWVTDLYLNKTNTDSVIWHISGYGGSGHIDTTFLNYDSIKISAQGGPGGDLYLGEFTVCVTAYNQCGSSSYCDTLVNYAEGINEYTLSNISIYPNPASNILTVDMRNNNEAISNNYTAIEVYNALGQKVLSEPRSNQYKTVNLPVSNLPDGIYLAVITDGRLKGTLGKFTVVK